MNCKSLFLTLLFAGLSILNISAQNLNAEALAAKVDSLMPESINDTTPGLVIGVVHKGELVFSKGYGLSNLAYGMKNTPQMAYNLGSVSKQFLGYAFAMLSTQGKVNLDDKVSKHLEDWPEFRHPVTIRHLLSHVSGYREAYTMSQLAGRTIGVDRLTQEECLNVVRKQPQLEFQPGSKYRYNSTAWVILAKVLESVTDQPADQWVEENLLQPLGMTHTHIESYVGEVIPNAAESYYQNGEEGYMNPQSNRAIFGAADVYTSIEDMALWLDNFRTAKIGGEKAREEFLKPFILNDGTDSEYALGISVRKHKGLKVYSHTGSHEAFLTQMRYYPESDIGIITMSNYGGSGWLPSNELAEYLLKDKMVFPEEEASEARVEVEESNQGEESEQASDLEIYRAQMGEQEMSEDSLAAIVDEKKRLAAVTDFPNEQEPQEADQTNKESPKKSKKKAKANPTVDLEPLEGMYRIIGGFDIIEVKLDGDTLVAWEDYKLIPVSEYIFRIDGWSAKLEFVVSEDHVQLILKGDKEEVYDQLDPWNPGMNGQLPYAGNYQCDEVESVFHLMYVDDQLVIRHRWMDDMPLTPVTNGVFKSENGWMLEFELSGSQITGYYLHAGRTTNVFFQRN